MKSNTDGSALGNLGRAGGGKGGAWFETMMEFG